LIVGIRASFGVVEGGDSKGADKMRNIHVIRNVREPNKALILLVELNGIEPSTS
jgi:hypothetical protein